MATSLTLTTAPKSTVHQALVAMSIALQLPTFSDSGLLLPSTAKDAPRPVLTLDWNVGLPSAMFTGPVRGYTINRYCKACIVGASSHCVVGRNGVFTTVLQAVITFSEYTTIFVG